MGKVIEMTPTRKLAPDNGTIRVSGREYSRGDIARGTGLSMSHVSRILSGRRVPSLRTARLLSRYFGIGLDDLDRVLGLATPAQISA